MLMQRSVGSGCAYSDSRTSRLSTSGNISAASASICAYPTRFGIEVRRLSKDRFYRRASQTLRHVAVSNRVHHDLQSFFVRVECVIDILVSMRERDVVESAPKHTTLQHFLL